MNLHLFRNSLLAIILIPSFILISCNKDDDKPSSGRDDFNDYTFKEPEVTGSTFYIDPVNGSPDGDGSANNPWQTLQGVLDSNLIQFYAHTENYNPDSPLELVNDGAPVKGGDRLILRSGHHGNIHQDIFMFDDWLTIEAAEGHQPIFSQIKFQGAFKNIYLKNLVIIKDTYNDEGNYWDADIINRNDGACLALRTGTFRGKGSFVKVNGLKIRTTEDITAWTAADWVEKSATGISLRNVENIEIVNCDIENISHGILVEYFSDYTSVINNKIKNFSADGARIISNDVLFAYNTISDCFKVDENHDDCIQSYSRGEDNSSGTGTLRNVVIRGNLIIGTTDFNNPLAGNPQGIGCFDGMFDNWTIENNVVIVDHYHGISFYGFTNSKIANNTVIDQNPDNSTCPWIRVTSHKNGTPSNNCTVANNIVSNSVSTEGNSIIESTNYVIGSNNYSQIYELFVDPDNFDFHLANNELTKAEIIDQGELFPSLFSSEFDKDNIARENNPDLGAYEIN